ncbi:group II intron reverse transcriptase/maturase [Chthoniobacter flavus]|uniref:group II intron reverse transcriptase/maturase n=1 Tax=Chthoniobacter flavus TaxID=191863 RepID=UPI001ED972F4|nr:group II intron reverse transcriptase/maturase [Chthoniobacter flavus]
MPDLWFGQNTAEPRDATCSAGEKSREGCGDGSQGLPAPDKVRQLQITLYRKAKSKPEYRFWSLYGEVQRADVLAAAWRRVKANAGAAGVDGVTIEELAADAQVEAAWLLGLREELQQKTYRPAPVRRVRIPKANGGFRGLGIPTVKDRVVQMAVYLVLMPIFEADFHPFSFGFRPGRGAHQAVEAIREALRMGKTEVVDADLAQYFDTIPHHKLMRRVARRVSDGMILKLIKAWLRAPILEEEEGGGRKIEANPCGTPQGGVISPLLANIYLHPLDEAVNDRCCDQRGFKPRMIRYADDLVILCHSGEGIAIRERLGCWLQSRGLTLNEKKTRVIESREHGFDFLGFSFRWQQSKNATSYVHVEPSPASKQSLRDCVREMTRRHTTWKSTEAVVNEINRVTRGWSNYFALDHYHRSFRQMNYFISHRLRQWLWRKHGNPVAKYVRWSKRELL